MALSFPRPLPTGFGFASVRFSLSRVQSVARTRGGAVQGTESGRTLWQAEMTTPDLRPDAYEELQAFFDSLRGSLNTFTMYNFIRRRPRAYPGFGWTGITRANGAAFDGTATLAASGGYAITLSNLPAAYHISPGDMVSWPWRNSRTLHRVVEGAVASGGSLVAQVEPDIPPGTVGAPTVKLGAADAVFRLTSADPIASNRLPLKGEPMSFSALQALY